MILFVIKTVVQVSKGLGKLLDDYFCVTDDIKTHQLKFTKTLLGHMFL